MADRLAARCNEGNDVTTVNDMKEVILSQGGLYFFASIFVDLRCEGFRYKTKESFSSNVEV